MSLLRAAKESDELSLNDLITRMCKSGLGKVDVNATDSSGRVSLIYDNYLYIIFILFKCSIIFHLFNLIFIIIFRLIIITEFLFDKKFNFYYYSRNFG